MNAHKLTTRSTPVMLLGLLGLVGCLPGGSGSAPTSPGSNPPTISGSPPTAVVAGSSYSFRPVAAGGNGDPLSFSVQNLPVWASFDSSTGAVAGQPTLGNVGVYKNIIISVSDGVSSASLVAFDITVSQVALGSMTLSWTSPTENTDGSSLSDLAGYRIYYGTSEGVYPNRVVIDTAGISSYVIENLVPDTYFVVATSVNAAGVESAFSNVAVKTVL